MHFDSTIIKFSWFYRWQIFGARPPAHVFRDVKGIWPIPEWERSLVSSWPPFYWVFVPPRNELVLFIHVEYSCCSKNNGRHSFLLVRQVSRHVPPWGKSRVVSFGSSFTCENRPLQILTRRTDFVILYYFGFALFFRSQMEAHSVSATRCKRDKACVVMIWRKSCEGVLVAKENSFLLFWRFTPPAFSTNSHVEIRGRPWIRTSADCKRRPWPHSVENWWPDAGSNQCFFHEMFNSRVTLRLTRNFVLCSRGRFMNRNLFDDEQKRNYVSYSRDKHHK